MRLPIHTPWVLALLLTLAIGCDTAEPGSSSPPPAGDEIVAGINLTELFRAPSPSEISTARATLVARGQGLASRYTFELADTRTAEDGAELRVYRATTSDTPAGGAAFYGAVRLPVRAPGDVRQRPLLLVLPDGDTGSSTDLLTDGTLPLDASERDDLVFALLTYRGTPLDAAGALFSSSLAPSPYDRDPDDALAFLDFAQRLGASALIDPQRVGVLGLGRGGGVALLTSFRTSAYDAVVDIAGPSDLFLSTFKSRVRAILEDRRVGVFPGIGGIAEAIVYPLREGALSIEEARHALLLRSPRYFIEPPPFTLAIHGDSDSVVPVQHSRALPLVMAGSGSGSAFLEVQEGDHTSILQRGEVVSLVTTQLRDRLLF